MAKLLLSPQVHFTNVTPLVGFHGHLKTMAKFLFVAEVATLGQQRIRMNLNGRRYIVVQRTLKLWWRGSKLKRKAQEKERGRLLMMMLSQGYYCTLSADHSTTYILF